MRVWLVDGRAGGLLWSCWWRGWCRGRHGWGHNKKRGNNNGKTGEKASFLPIFTFDFLLPKAWNPPLFIRGGKWTFYLYWCQISGFDSVRKDSNRGLKMVIMNCQIWQLKVAWVSIFEPALRPLWCQSATKNYIGVWSSVMPSNWCMVIWFGWEMKH